MEAPPLPPVPESLREMMRRQLAAPPARQVRSERNLLRSCAADARWMQRFIAMRTQRPGSLAHVDGGWANAGDWQQLLADVDQAIAALRAAWQQVKDTEPAVREVVRTWREANGVAPDLLINEDSEEFWLFLSPTVQQARGNADSLLDKALEQWGEVGARYTQMFKKTKPALAYGPQLPPPKTAITHQLYPPTADAA